MTSAMQTRLSSKSAARRIAPRPRIPASFPALPYARIGSDDVLSLQRTLGNQAVQQLLIARDPAPRHGSMRKPRAPGLIIPSVLQRTWKTHQGKLKVWDSLVDGLKWYLDEGDQTYHFVIPSDHELLKKPWRSFTSEDKLKKEKLFAHEQKRLSLSAWEDAGFKVPQGEIREYLDFRPHVLLIMDALGEMAASGKGGRIPTLLEAIQEIGSLGKEVVPKKYPLPLESIDKTLKAAQTLVAMLAADPKSDSEKVKDVLGAYAEKGVYVRKIGSGLPGGNAKEDLEKDESTIRYIAEHATQPRVMPSTFVAGGVPVNLTDAGGSITHASGEIWGAETAIAPSTKEHSESVRLAGELPASLNIQDFQVFKDKVRKVVEEKGGRAYETREGLLAKLREMTARQRGESPDFGTKEILFEALKYARDHDEHGIDLEHFEKVALPTAIKALSKGKLELLDVVAKQVLDRIGKTIAELKQSSKTPTVGELAGLVKTHLAKPKAESRREHSGYTKANPSDPRNRYFVEKSDEEGATKKGDVYTGESFRTTEALLLPVKSDMVGVFANVTSSSSMFHAINILLESGLQEFQAQSLFTYNAKEGLAHVSLADMLNRLEAKLHEEAAQRKDALEKEQSDKSSKETGVA